nr:hypothetical protein [Tanacetum cinerariifolium]
KFSLAVPSVDKEKALWVELKRLFELDAYDVLWKLQRYMHAPLTWKLYTDCRVHHVSSTRKHDIFMLTKKDYLLSNAVMILMLSGKLQVEEDNKMDRNLVMKIFMEANKPKSRTKDNVVQNLKKKPISIAQARKNMIIYLKNMAGYKMEHLRGMTYDKVKPIFERDYKKVQNLFKPDKDVEERKKKRVADETLL